MTRYQGKRNKGFDNAGIKLWLEFTIFSSHFSAGPVLNHNTIIEYVNKNSIDLVIVATHGRSGLSRLVLGSVADRVLHGYAEQY
jgi:nucleotide-binding universal stress UspA family protein